MGWVVSSRSGIVEPQSCDVTKKEDEKTGIKCALEKSLLSFPEKIRISGGMKNTPNNYAV